MSAASSPARQNRPEGFTLVQAAECGDVGTVEVLLAAGADVNAATQHGMTALMSAAAKGHLGLVSLLLERGADINAKRHDGLDALALSVFFGHLDVVRELLGRGADPKAKVRFGTSPAMWATTRGFHDIAQILTEAKAANSRETTHRSDEVNAPSPELTGAQEPILREAFFSDEGPSAETLSHSTEASPISARVLPDFASQDVACRFGELYDEWSTGWTNSSELTLESPASIWNMADDAHKENEVRPRNSGTIAEPMTSEVTLNGTDTFAPVITQQPRALPVEQQPSPIYSTYVAKPRYHHKPKFPKLVRCLAYITSGWQRLTVTTLTVMLLCGLGTFAFLNLLSPSQPFRVAKPAYVAEPSAPALPQFNPQNHPHSTTRAKVFAPESAINDASGEQSVDSAKNSNDAIGPEVDRIEHPRNLPVAEKSLEKPAERVTGARPKQAMSPKRETQAVLHPAPSFRSASVSAKTMPSRRTADLALEDNSAKVPPPAPPAPLSIEVQRPRSVAARNDSPAPAATAGRTTKTKVIQWP